MHVGEETEQWQQWRREATAPRPTPHHQNQTEAVTSFVDEKLMKRSPTNQAASKKTNRQTNSKGQDRKREASKQQKTKNHNKTKTGDKQEKQEQWGGWRPL